MNRAKLYIEDTVILVVITVVLYYASTYTYSFIKNTNFDFSVPDVNISMLKIDTDILLKKYINNSEEPIVTSKKTSITNNESVQENKKTNSFLIEENNETTNIHNNEKKDLNTSINPNIIKEKKLITDNSTNEVSLNIIVDKNNTNLAKNYDPVIQPLLNQKDIKEVKIKKEKIDVVKKDDKIKKEILVKKDTAKVLTTNEDVIKISKTKKLMLNDLNAYIKYVRNKVNNNTTTLYNVQNDKLSINIRITLLDDGRFQNLIYVSGNEKLLVELKKTLRKINFNKPNMNIKSQFPRYIRFKVNFKNQ